MNDQTNKTQNSVTDDKAQQGSVVNQSSDQTASSQQSVSTPSKEGAPIPTIKPAEKWVQENAPEVNLPQEVADAGVEAAKSEVMKVAPELQQQGVQPVGIAVPIPEEPVLKLPITEGKAQGVLKMHKKVKESVTWLAMLVVRQMQVLRFNKEKKEKETTI